MAALFTFKHLLVAAALFSLAALCYSQQDPSQIVAKALVCFNNQIYNSCQEDFRLNESGNLNVPPEATDQYCNGPCLDETGLVLNCLDGILSPFIFFNRATIGNVRATIKAACSYTSERGDFDVARHIQDEYGGANKHVAAVRMVIVATVVLASYLLL